MLPSWRRAYVITGFVTIAAGVMIGLMDWGVLGFYGGALVSIGVLTALTFRADGTPR
jgi:hypothetical protein